MRRALLQQSQSAHHIFGILPANLHACSLDRMLSRTLSHARAHAHSHANPDHPTPTSFAPPPRVAGIKGFNYVPSWAVNDIDMWRDYDASVVERDMAIAATVGFNFARVFLNYVVWDAQREGFLASHQSAHRSTYPSTFERVDEVRFSFRRHAMQRATGALSRGRGGRPSSPYAAHVC